MVDQGKLSTYLITVYVIIYPFIVALIPQLGLNGDIAGLIVGVLLAIYNFAKPRAGDNTPVAQPVTTDEEI